MRRNENHEERRARYEQEDVNGKLVFTLLNINHIMRGLYEGRGSQKQILIVLQETGTITQRELTERLGIQPGSASEVIAKLENAGLVDRTASETDRRTADISLTEEGRRQAKEVKNQRVQRHVEMFSALTEEERAHLLALLEKVNADWETRYADQRRHHKDHHHGHHHEESGAPHSDRRGHHHPGGELREASAFHEEGGSQNGRHGCDHDCENCPHPCPKGRARLEGSR